ncbi:MAG: AraC family transcriptional regulator [Agathobaculum sp.]|uniref:AraC family transcriptional regulator n=1 Tax=Agathobaculum sp. TaxID=2048138 RepID=UPI003D8F6721
MKQKDRKYMKNIVELPFSGYKFVLCYAEQLTQDVAEFPHNHFEYELYYVLNGRVEINIAGNVQSIPAGEACLLARDIKHHVYYEPDTPRQYMAVIFDVVPCERVSMNGPDGVNEYGDIQQVLQELDKIGFLRLREPPHAAELAKAWRREIEERRLGWNTQAVMLCYQLVMLSMRQVCSAPVQDCDFSGKDNLAMAVTMYIHEHYPEDITVESAAKALNVSPRHVNRAYKSEYSTTFMKNANLLRIAYAKNYLCTTDYSMEEIAERIGFSSVRTLYKLFQQYEGLSLSQYREQHKKRLAKQQNPAAE